MSEVQNTSEEAKAPQEEVKQPAEPPAPPASGETKPTDDATVKALESATATLEKAEHTIVQLKRQLKDAGVSEADPEEAPALDPAALEAIIDRKVEEKLKANQPDPTVTELKAAHTTIGELTAALKAKATTSASSQGTNQDRYEPETDPLKPLSPADRAFIEARARRSNQTVKEYLKHNPLSQSGIATKEPS
jgi:Tfp pilus assembly protein PilX